jgi:ATP-dependent helicase HrpA
VPADAWDWSKVPDHLRMTYRVEDDEGRTLGEGKDLAALQRQLAPSVRDTIADVARDLERAGLTSWSVGEIPRSVQSRRGDLVVRGYPALVDEGPSVGLRVLATTAEQQRAMAAGVRRLLLLSAPSPVKALVPRLDNRTKLALAGAPHGGATALMDDCVAAAVDALVAEAGGVPWDAVAYDRVQAHVRSALTERFGRVVRDTAGVLEVAAELRARLGRPVPAAVRPAVDEVRAQLDALVRPGFVAATGADRLPDLLRWLRAAGVRLDRALTDPARDAALAARVRTVAAEVATALAGLPPAARDGAAARRVRRLVEELRVSLWAQTLGTAEPVSEQRIYRALDELEEGSSRVR